MPTCKLSLDEGVLAASAPVDVRIDAAVHGDMAGIELIGLEHANVNIGLTADRHPGVTLALEMHPATLMRVALTALEALGTPTFTQPEWLDIANALRTLGTYDANPTNIAPERLRDLAERIFEAYS